MAIGAETSEPRRRGGAGSALARFLDSEARGGLILIGGAALALAGSFLSALAGYGLLRFAAAPKTDVSVRDAPGPSD